ncbi:FG-GAP repeat domain-containing protein [Planctomycetaceae bacterium SH139]
MRENHVGENRTGGPTADSANLASDSRPDIHQTAPLTAETEAAIVAFCGDCHIMPQASSFPRHAWRAEVQRGYDFYYASGRNDLEIPIRGDTLAYFTSRAPEQLHLSAPAKPNPTWQTQLERTEVTIPDIADAAISFVDVVVADPPFGRSVLFSDMRGGGVYLAKIDAGQIGSPRRIGQVNHPAAVRMTDWDGDGQQDFIVSDLGSFLPEDNTLGQVVCLRREPDSDNFSAHVLCRGIGRVASVETADFDSDGQTELLVAEFGWHETGSIFLARRDPSGATFAELTRHRLDSRPGTIHVPLTDLNQDGHLDFIALISQHFERIEAFINDGRGNFVSQPIYEAPDPSFGSSGIQLVDINDDGRQDILYTNGDAFDSFILKPFHSVRWFENIGDGNFQPHLLGPLPGAHRAIAEDVTGNGLPDVVAGAFLPRDLLLSANYQEAEAVVLWEQVEVGVFEQHVLDNEGADHAALTVHDINEDGRADIILGNFREGGTQSGSALTILTSKR